MENIYFSVVKMLLIAIAFACGVLLFFRYAGKLKLGSFSKSHSLNKVETIHLGYRKFVSVLEIRDHVLVVGVGDKELSLLAQWKNEEKSL
jgi:flagellar biogenesis protein FliO